MTVNGLFLMPVLPDKLTVSVYDPATVVSMDDKYDPSARSMTEPVYVSDVPVSTTANTAPPDVSRRPYWSAWFRVQGAGFRVQGSGFRVQG